MWLIITFISALTATLLWHLLHRKYQLGFLSLMLWGAAIMILIDHLLGYEGGRFIELKTDGLITSGAWLSIIMLVPVLIVWLIALIIAKLSCRFNGWLRKQPK